MISTLFPSAAFELPPATPDMQVLPGDAVGAFHLAGQQQQLGLSEICAVRDKSFRRVLRLSTSVGATQEWHVQAVAKNVRGVRAGDTVLAKFHMRYIEATAGEGAVAFVIELCGDGPVACCTSSKGRGACKLVEVHLSVGS